MLRSALLVVSLTLTACPSSPQTVMCQTDTDCSGGDICARNGECDAPSDVRAVKVTWLIRAMPASAQTCANSPSFYVQFDGPTYEDTFAFEPVPCDQGQFNIDKLPKRFTQVEMGIDGQFNDIAAIDPATETAAFDLFP